jgi:exopolysaccharide production protein ExoQ
LALFALVTLRAIHQTIALTVTAPRDGWLWCIVLILSVLVMNLTESNMLMQNDIIWILFSTAVLTGSYNHAEARRSKPHFMRVSASAT